MNEPCRTTRTLRIRFSHPHTSSRHSRRTEPTQRSATAFAFAALMGVLTTGNPSVRSTSFEAPRELGVSISEQDVLVLEASGDREVPRLLRDPGRVGPTGRAGDGDPSTREVDEGQDVERLKEHRLNSEEVALEHSPPLRSEELSPGRARPPRAPAPGRRGEGSDGSCSRPLGSRAH